MESKKIKFYLPTDALCYVLLPLPFLWAFFNAYTFNIYTIFASISSLLLFAFSLYLNKNIIVAKYLGIFALSLCFLSALPLIISPFMALFSLVLFITIFFQLLYLDTINQQGYTHKHNKYWNDQLRFAFVGLLVVLVCNLIFYNKPISYLITSISSCIAFIIHFKWSVKQKYISHSILALGAFLLCGILFLTNYLVFLSFFSLAYCIFIFLFYGRHNYFFKNKDNSLQFLFEKPEYSLVIFFVLLSTIGSLALLLPFSTTNDSIAVIDIVFTVVSAACVTGLVSIDVGSSFTMFGQFIIMLLIQLGGLGIMSITIFIAYLFRKKLSMAQEKVLTEIASANDKTLISSLIIILKVTFIVESIGAVILTACYVNYGETFSSALWKGIFTSISAFCNAGFALNSDNLIMYQSSPILLYTVSFLAIIGGIAPATCLFIPAWISGKHIPMGARIPLVMTAYLLIIGTILLLIFLTFKSKVQR